MELEDLILDKKKIVILIVGILMLIVGIVIYFFYAKGEETVSSMDIFNENEEELQKENIQKENEDENILNQTADYKQEEKIAVHVTGEVNRVGLIYLEKGARIADAISEAGGATEEASLEQVNLAYVLEDGQKIYIPNKKEKIEIGQYIILDSGNNVLQEEGSSQKRNNVIGNTAKGGNQKVNINSAGQNELETLTGIGSSLAKRIIEYRQANGNFKKIEDIQNIKGIGNSKYSRIKDSICI